jgi:hypothetical protein
LFKRKPIPTVERLYISTLISLFTYVVKQQIKKERKKERKTEYEINKGRKPNKD